MDPCLKYNTPSSDYASIRDKLFEDKIQQIKQKQLAKSQALNEEKRLANQRYKPYQTLKALLSGNHLASKKSRSKKVSHKSPLEQQQQLEQEPILAQHDVEVTLKDSFVESISIYEVLGEEGLQRLGLKNRDSNRDVKGVHANAGVGVGPADKDKADDQKQVHKTTVQKAKKMKVKKKVKQDGEAHGDKKRGKEDDGKPAKQSETMHKNKAKMGSELQTSSGGENGYEASDEAEAD